MRVGALCEQKLSWLLVWYHMWDLVWIGNGTDCYPPCHLTQLSTVLEMRYLSYNVNVQL